MSTTFVALERSRANLGALIEAAAAEAELTTRQAAEAAEQASQHAYQRGFDAGYDLGADAVRDQLLAILDGLASAPGMSPCFLDALRLAVRSAGVKGRGGHGAAGGVLGDRCVTWLRPPGAGADRTAGVVP